MKLQGTYDGVNWVDLKPKEGIDLYAVVRSVASDPDEPPTRVYQVYRLPYLCDFYEAKLREGKVEFSYITMLSADQVVIHGVNGLTFAKMERVAEILETKHIDVNCDRGGSSDLSLDVDLYVSHVSKRTIPLELYELVLHFFSGDKTRTRAWFFLTNPLLGEISPIDMIALGKTDKVRKFIDEAIASSGGLDMWGR